MLEAVNWNNDSTDDLAVFAGNTALSNDSASGIIGWVYNVAPTTPIALTAFTADATTRTSRLPSGYQVASNVGRNYSVAMVGDVDKNRSQELLVVDRNFVPLQTGTATNPLPNLGRAYLLSGQLSQSSIPVTFTVGAPGTINSTAHGLVAGDLIVFNTTGSLPTGLTGSTAYYVLSANFTANSFRVRHFAWRHRSQLERHADRLIQRRKIDCHQQSFCVGRLWIGLPTRGRRYQHRRLRRLCNQHLWNQERWYSSWFDALCTRRCRSVCT